MEPQEHEVTKETLCIFGGELRKYLERKRAELPQGVGICKTDESIRSNPNQMDVTTGPSSGGLLLSGNSISNSKDGSEDTRRTFYIDSEWPFWIRMIFEVANEVWSGMYQRPPEEYPAKEQVTARILRRNIEKNINKIGKDKADFLETIIRPLWARRNVSKNIKLSRSTHITPEMERIVKVLGDIKRFEIGNGVRPQRDLILEWLTKDGEGWLSDHVAKEIPVLLRPDNQLALGVSRSKRRK